MDEADKMLDSGNEVQLQNILQLMPKQRRTGLFSATMPTTLKQFVRVGMRNPYFIDVKMEQQSGNIFQLAGQTIGKGIDTTKISALTDEKSSGLSGSDQINRISELPRGLKNYYHIVDSQK